MSPTIRALGLADGEVARGHRGQDAFPVETVVDAPTKRTQVGKARVIVGVTSRRFRSAKNRARPARGIAAAGRPRRVFMFDGIPEQNTTVSRRHGGRKRSGSDSVAI